MRNPNRISYILEKLEEYWQNNPDLRLGQIVSNINATKMGNHDDVFYLEDDILLDGLEEYNKDYEKNN